MAKRGFFPRLLLAAAVCISAAAAVQRLAPADFHRALAGEWKLLVDDDVVEAARQGAALQCSQVRRSGDRDRDSSRVLQAAEECWTASYVVKTDRAAAPAALQRLREFGEAQVMGKEKGYVLVQFHGRCDVDIQAELQRVCSDSFLGAHCADVAQYPLSLKVNDQLLDAAARVAGRSSLSRASATSAGTAREAPVLLLRLNPAMTSHLPQNDVRESLQQAVSSAAAQARVEASYLTQVPHDQRVRDDRTLKRQALRDVLLGAQTAECQFDGLSWEVSLSRTYASVGGFPSERCALIAAARLAATAVVLHVEEKLPQVPFNSNTKWVMQSFVQTPPNTPIWDRGLNGTGLVLGISDTGIDQESCYFNDPNGPLPAAVIGDYSYDLSRRKVVQYVRATDSDGTDTLNGHGTHVAGTAVGESLDDPTYNGLAFGAKVAFFDSGLSGSLTLKQPADLGDIFEHAYAAGARVHSNSWGYASSTSNYDTRSQQVDAYLHEHPDMLVIFAAGNDGSSDGNLSVAPPAQSKNALAVGATQGGSNARFMLAGSSQGPVPDDRLKPDVVAPGGLIYSAAASAISGGVHSPSCGVNSQSGTSMATPAVGAAAILIQEYFQSGYYPSTTRIEEDSRNLTNAMLKAILVNSGQPLQTPTEFPNNQQGHGRVQLDRALPFDGNFKLLVEERTCTNDEVYTFPLEVRSRHLELSATLTWMDPPGRTSFNKHVINDIHVSAVRGDTTFFPNGLSGPDPKNNVQRIVIPTWNLQVGDSIDLVVSCTDIVDPPQTFAIALTGYFDWLNDTYNYTSAGIFQPTPAPTMAPTIAPPPTPAPTLAPIGDETDDDEFQFQSFSSWAGSVEGSTIISGGVFVVITCAFLGYRSCVPKRTKDKLAARALARAVAEYRREEAQYLQQLENLRSPAQPNGEPDLYIDRRGSGRRPSASTRAEPISPISPGSPSLLVLRDHMDGASPGSRQSRRHSTGSASPSGRHRDSRRGSHRIDMGDAQIAMTELRNDRDSSRRDHLNYIRDSIY